METEPYTLDATRGGKRIEVLIDAKDAVLDLLSWHVHRAGHVERTFQHAGVREKIKLSRAVVGALPHSGMHVRHKNGNKLDCRKENLVLLYGGLR